MTQERDAIISKVRKFAQMTEANGASEAEAAMAAKLLAKLMAEYNIQQTELTIRADAQGCIVDQFSVTEGEIWRQACWPIGRVFGVKAWTSKSKLELGLGLDLDQWDIKYYGFPQDVAAAISLARIVYVAILRASAQFAKTLKGKGKAEAIQSFTVGMTQRLAARIEELVPPKVESSGRGLMVLKDQLVSDEFASYCKAEGLRFSSYRAVSARDTAAYRQGQSAANNVALGHKGVNASTTSKAPASFTSKAPLRLT